VTVLLYLRPSSWSLPLFVHVLGATVLFGGTLAVAILVLVAWRRRDLAALLSRLAFRLLLFFVLPAWILMRVGAGWIDGKEFPKNEPGWVGVGYVVSEGGLVLLVVMAVLAWRSARGGGTGRAAGAVAVLAPLYLVALAVAWFAMSAKPGA
jgi:D-alanyl-lipoteichoic acid acyltransferase DltB (MBOAT superfamily)